MRERQSRPPSRQDFDGIGKKKKQAKRGKKRASRRGQGRTASRSRRAYPANPAKAMSLVVQAAERSPVIDVTRDCEDMQSTNGIRTKEEERAGGASSMFQAAGQNATAETESYNVDIRHVPSSPVQEICVVGTAQINTSSTKEGNQEDEEELSEVASHLISESFVDDDSLWQPDVALEALQTRAKLLDHDYCTESSKDGRNSTAETQANYEGKMELGGDEDARSVESSNQSTDETIEEPQQRSGLPGNQALRPPPKMPTTGQLNSRLAALRHSKHAVKEQRPGQRRGSYSSGVCAAHVKLHQHHAPVTAAGNKRNSFSSRQPSCTECWQGRITLKRKH